MRHAVSFPVNMLLLVLLVVGSAPVEGALCAVDPVPAATLLFPFVVFDFNDPDYGIDTQISITNLSSEAQVVFVQVWSDLAVPVLGFNVVLSGYDVQRIDVRSILRDGELPLTGTSGELVVQRSGFPAACGPVSHSNARHLDEMLPESQGTDTLVARCAPDGEGYPGDRVLGTDDLVLIQELLQASRLLARDHSDCQGGTSDRPSRQLWWQRDEERPTWMYITADVVEGCGLGAPDDPRYWERRSRRALQQNVLVGDLLWTFEDSAAFDLAVHIEAGRGLEKVAEILDGAPISFYYRYSSAAQVESDLREPLPTAWALRYNGIGTSERDTRIRLWKGSTLSPTTPDLVSVEDGGSLVRECASYTYYAWDEDETVVQPTQSTANLFPLAVQEVSASELETPGSDGWLLFVWPASNWPSDAPEPVPDYYQTWMGILSTTWTDGLNLAGATSGTVAGHYSCHRDQVLPGLGIDTDLVRSSSGERRRPRRRVE